MKKLLFTLFVAITSTSFAQKQKVAVDDNLIKVDGVSIAKMEKKGLSSPTYTILSLEGVEIMHWQFLEFNDPKKVGGANASGRVTYYQVTFFGDKQQCEISPTITTAKGIAKCIVENKLIQYGQLDQEAENNFVLVNGMKFTEEKKTIGGGTVIINN